MIDRRIKDIISLASKYPTIKRVGIFGSFVRGDAKSNSDIDLLYDYDDSKAESTDELLGYIEEINDALIGYAQIPKIDYVWYKGVLESHNTKFRDAVLNDVSWVYNRT